MATTDGLAEVRRGPTLAACLIVRDEEAVLAECLGSLDGVVDEIVVYDTGSVDRTIEIAESSGALVVAGSWTGNFSAARNAALGAVSSDWVLSIDADERAVADPAALRDAIRSGSPGAYLVQIHQLLDPNVGSSYRYATTKLFRRQGARWSGWVHERPCDGSGCQLPAQALDPAVLSFVHEGCWSAEAQRERARRNAEIGTRELHALAAEDGSPERERVAHVLLDLGRSLTGMGNYDDAVATFEVLRDLAPGSRQAVHGTDYLVRLLLGAGRAVEALELVEDLRGAGEAVAYCDWLAGQAHVQLGDAAGAWRLIAPISEVVDTAGRRSDAGELHEVRALVAAAAGHHASAADDLAEAMVTYGRVVGRGALLRHLWWAAGRRGDPLAELAGRDGPYCGAILREAMSGDQQDTPSRSR